MNQNDIRDRLLQHGKALFNAPRLQVIQFTKVPAADALYSDLTGHPHAYVLANIMNQQMNAQKAWLIPYKISQKLHGFSMDALRSLSLDDVVRLMKHPKPLHHYVNKMGKFFHLAVQRIHERYADDASRMWAGRPSTAEVIHRFREFDGVGPKISHLAVNDLARRFKVPFQDYSSIDISADVHVRRVFARLGLCAADATAEQIICAARALHPEFPGMLDFACYEIGRNWCKARGPECSACYMRNSCAIGSGEK